MDCALPCLFVIIIYFMGGLRLTAGAFFANLFGLVLNVLVAQSLGLLLGVAFMNPKTAQVSGRRCVGWRVTGSCKEYVSSTLGVDCCQLLSCIQWQPAGISDGV